MKELLLNEFKEIDILPLDHFDSNPEVAAQEAERIKRYMGRLGYTKVDKPHTQNPLKFAVWSLILGYHRLWGGGYYQEDPQGVQ